MDNIPNRKLLEESFSFTAHALSRHGLKSIPQSSYRWRSIRELENGAERFDAMVVRSAGLRKVVNSVQHIAPHFSSVLIQGESGTGKELIARAIHRMGPHRGGPFVAVNCAALFDSTAQSQPFGQVNGIFSDADDDRVGYFHAAKGGTLFLDHIADLPMRLQSGLLRAFETHGVQPVDPAESAKVRVKIVAATNRNLRAMMAAGQFRADLYYRLAATVLDVPPLRNRREDIGPLVAEFAAHCSLELNKPIRFISNGALNALCEHQWPGNIRELSNLIRSAAMLTDVDRLSVEDLVDLGLESATREHLRSERPQRNPLTRSHVDLFLTSATPSAMRRAARHTGC